MVGDSGHDIEAGKRAGVRTVLVEWSILNMERLKAISPDYIISDPKEILDIINVN
jgi:pyrophosphatase PpaX